MNELFPLSALSAGQSGYIRTLSNPEPMRRRLLDLGFLPGQQVTCTACGPRGGLGAYLIRGAVIALRRADASLVYLGPLPS